MVGLFVDMCTKKETFFYRLDLFKSPGSTNLERSYESINLYSLFETLYFNNSRIYLIAKFTSILVDCQYYFYLRSILRQQYGRMD